MITSKIIIDEDRVRNYCIKNNRFTKGNNAQYDDMFSYIRKFNKTQNKEALKNACILIVKHSDLSAYGQTEKENIQSICFDLINDCATFFVNMED